MNWAISLKLGWNWSFYFWESRLVFRRFCREAGWIAFIRKKKTQHITAAAAESLQLCLTLCDPIDGSPPGCSVPGILQARTLEWVAISFSNAWKWKVKVKSFSRVWPSATPWTVAFRAPPSMGFSRQEYWSGVPLPSLHITANHQIDDSKDAYFINRNIQSSIMTLMACWEQVNF